MPFGTTMPLIPIDSPTDPRVQPYADLRNRQLHVRDGLFVAEGDLVVGRLLESGYQVESLLVSEDRLTRLPLPDAVTTYCAPRSLVESLAGFRFHRGILACGRRPAPGDLASLVVASDQPTTVVVCAAIQDPENLGGILRNCAAFGVDLVVIGENSADPLSRRVLRVSMGTVLKLRFYQSAQLEQDVWRLRDEFSIHLAASVADPCAPTLLQAPRPRRLGLLLGNERAGLSPALVEGSQSRFTIPMQLQTDSLNVAVTSGIFLYHFSNRTGDSHW